MNLKEKLRKTISDKGYVTVKEYMQLCLFDEEGGYYIKNYPIGKDGDFITAPEISQMFGEMIATYIIDRTNNYFLDEESIFLYELGAGKGTLMSDILRVIKKFPEIYSKLNVTIVDVSEELIKHQKKSLSEHIDIINWQAELRFSETKPTIIFCNEFFDALPASQFYYENNEWLERVVTLNDKGEFVFSHKKTRLSEKISKNKNLIGNKSGDIYELNELSVALVHQISEHLYENRGIFITFDYGYMKNEFRDTIQSIKNHEYNNIFCNIGNADITAHVDFSALKRVAQKSKIKDIFYYTQGDFLQMMGINERAKILSQNNKKVEKDLNRLVAKDEMGEIFKCLLIEKLS